MPKDFKKEEIESLRELGKRGRWKTWVCGWGYIGEVHEQGYMGYMGRGTWVWYMGRA